ncbi:S8 family peptidase [Jiangella alkaliphila]|uniref:Serine protease, subtilisin family n=1 Tax=Jiangella alkaliphila TaxID=419479 RepID=A0A1H2GLQ9_9ACTN|nr:S8 family serine peptidase [Jiangella alkaliphila]SDU20391.1 Serine protease, subtilisin family [Jiangella alkaliphila]
MNRRLLLGISAVVVAIVAAVAVVLVTRDDGDNPSATLSDALSDEQRALIERAEPSPDCPDEPVAAPDDESLVALDVLRVDENDCLVAATEYVAPDEVDDRRAELLEEPGVVAAGVVGEVGLDEEDDRRDDQWSLDRLGAEEDSPDLPWPDGHGAVLAVLDTGVDETHPDLGDAVLERRHYPGEGEHDPDGHGTHVAGIAAARRDNGGIIGVAPRVSVLDVPVRLKDVNDAGPSWPTGLAWAVNHGADAVNMSFGGPIPAAPDVEELQDLEVEAAAVYFAVSNDVVVVSSGGNCGPSPLTDCADVNQRQTPSSLPGVIAVGAVQDDLDLAGYSTRNEDIDLVAPGGGDLFTGVLSTYPGGGYESLQGTSQAAPHVAAAAALIRAAAPEASGDEIGQALLDTADLDRLDEGDREGRGVGRGFLDIAGALEQVLAGAPPATSPPADRTRTAFVRDDELFAFDGAEVGPVRTIDPGTAVRWLDWTADGSLLVGADDGELFAWDGSALVEAPCGWCSESRPAFLEDVEVEGATGDFVVGMDYAGTMTWYDAATLDEVASTTPTFPADAVGTKTLLGAVGGQLLVHESGGAQASERVWLLDPASGAAELSADVMGSPQAPIAVAADGAQVAVVTGYGACGAEVTVLDAAGLTELAVAPVPEDLILDEVFFNGEALYATMEVAASDCSALQPDGLWRLDRGRWQEIDESPIGARPLEGIDDDTAESWLVAGIDGQGGFNPPLTGDPSANELGPITDGPWATPTTTEVPWP